MKSESQNYRRENGVSASETSETSDTSNTSETRNTSETSDTGETSGTSDTVEVPISRTFLASEIEALESLYQKLRQAHTQADVLLISLEMKARSKEAKIAELESKLVQCEQENSHLKEENWSLRELVDKYCTEARQSEILLEEIEKTMGKRQRKS